MTVGAQLRRRNDSAEPRSAWLVTVGTLSLVERLAFFDLRRIDAIGVARIQPSGEGRGRWFLQADKIDDGVKRPLGARIALVRHAAADRAGNFGFSQVGIVAMPGQRGIATAIRAALTAPRGDDCR